MHARIDNEEAIMAIAMMVDNPNGSQEIYERVRELLGMERPAGGIFHVAGPSPNGGWRVIEVWESEEDAQRFVSERLRPAFEAVGVPGPPQPPQFWPVHNYMA
ncbi:MAG: hypothetical protein ACRDM0_08490 [Thermoleophilaceae bacterium]